MSPLPNALLESVAAAAVREGLADALYTRLNTPIGRLLVVSGPEGLVRIAFESEAEDVALAEVAGALGPRVIGSDAEMTGPRGRAAGLLRGRAARPARGPAPAPARRSGTRCWSTCGRCRAGETVSYGELAARAGNPKAARAVGTACARNPVPIVVPCHRVLPGTGRLGSYRGGPERKAALLELEGAAPR